MIDAFVPDGDPPIDDVRRARHELSARFNHDPARLIAYLMSRQDKNPDGLISYEDDAASAVPQVAPVAAPTALAVSSGV